MPKAKDYNSAGPSPPSSIDIRRAPMTHVFRRKRLRTVPHAHFERLAGCPI